MPEQRTFRELMVKLWQRVSHDWTFVWRKENFWVCKGVDSLRVTKKLLQLFFAGSWIATTSVCKQQILQQKCRLSLA